MGFLKVIKGSMGAGKSARAIVEHSNFKFNKIKVCVIKPASDKRDGDKVRSRIMSGEIKADFVLAPENDVPINHLIKENYEYVIVDEAHMLTVEQVKQLNYLTAISNISVHMYGLTMSWIGEPFLSFAYALGYADIIETIGVPNKQGQLSTYHIRYDAEDVPCDIDHGEEIVTGDLDTYETVSKSEFFRTYYKKMQKKFTKV